MKNLVYLFLAGILALASCSKDDPQPIAVGSVTLNKTTLTLAVGQQTTLTATVLPENAEDKSVTWRSSAPTIATVSDAGVVTAIAAGSATITATAAGKSASCAVTVDPVTVESVTLDKTELTLKRDESETLTATVLPDNAADKTVVWSSDTPDVATVDESGVVTGVKSGAATITATAGGKWASCAVTVEPIAVESVTLDKTELKLKRGESETLMATVLPDNADENIVVWSSDTPDVATVDESGVVTGVKPGSATITATAGGMMATCAVTVESVELDKTELTLKREETATLKATVLPADAADKTVTWSSDKPDVATVDKSGVVTGVKPGAATITATAGDISASCSVTVEPDVYAVGYVNSAYDSRITYLWKNGAANVLPFLDVRSVFVSEGDVYVAGTYKKDSGENTAGVWKNGTLTELSDRNCYARSVFVSGGNVYVAGHAGGNKAYLWENGVQKELESPNFYSAAYSVFVSEGDVYVGGDRRVSSLDGRAATYWKNGVATDLTDGTLYSRINSIVVAKGVLYVAGYERTVEEGQKGVLWRDNVPTYLPEGGIAYDVKVYENGDVYVAGSCIDGSAGLWKNGVLTKLVGKGDAYGVFAYGNDVYVVGQSGYKAVLWKNGVMTELPGDANYALSIFVY